MGEGTGVGWLEGSIHHHLQVLEKPIGIRTLLGGCNNGLGAHQRQRGCGGRTSQPTAEKVTGLMEKRLQARINAIRRCEGIEGRRGGPVVRGDVHRRQRESIDSRLSWDGAQKVDAREWRRS